ncbi:sigma-70 family RNA polymerase sigma factor [Rhodopseudomonas sp. P2A-2r]|uniref:RNA polymerase sigma factor n=1 Tax=Rhodopseudomonas sp. P2A-2r TaxID=2991972 RepID=UPI002233E36A|nr:sigma-70 family RNA polymerase sigma factor [Rhodopseudomonas sp. P2A-2r]UZE46942.1 sigma-70 family RNA polymerase sigma factor [Rhodopseudomonas sp. P2A-2r]
MSPPRFAVEFIDRIMAERPALRRRAAFLIGSRAQIGSPDDFLQDTIITALQSADRVVDDNLGGWLMALLHNHIRNARRRAHVHTSVPLVTTDAGDPDEIEVPVAASQEFMLDVDDAMRALRTLSAADQEIIWLARIEELPNEEIATRLGLPLATLYSRLSRATARLRAAYAAEPAAAKTLACPLIIAPREDAFMVMRICLVAGFNGGAGRTLTAALLAYGLYLQDGRTMLVRQTCEGFLSTIDPIETTLPLPCSELALPPPYALPSDLPGGMTAMIHGADGRFMAALHDMAMSEVGNNGNVVVDLSSHERAFNVATMRDAAVILLPARSSAFEVDWSVRSLARACDIQRYREARVPTLIASIVPEAGRARQMELLSQMVRACDPEHELVPGEPSELVVEVPFLDDATLLSLFDERSIWLDPHLMARCRAFATAVTVQSDAFMSMLADADDL